MILAMALESEMFDAAPAKIRCPLYPRLALLCNASNTDNLHFSLLVEHRNWLENTLRGQHNLY
jgi:hypothetical protein